MTYFTPVEPDAASGKAADLLTQVQKTLGSTPNMTKVMANSPTLLKSYLALFGAVASGTIPAAVRARLAIATAQLNGCEYGLASHTYIGANITKVDAAELVKARVAKSTDRHVAALLKLSNTIAENAGGVDETDIRTARQAGVTEEEIEIFLRNRDAAGAVRKREDAIVGRTFAIDGDCVEGLVHDSRQRAPQQRRLHGRVGRQHGEHGCHEWLDHAGALRDAADPERSVRDRDLHSGFLRKRIGRHDRASGIGSAAARKAGQLD